MFIDKIKEILVTQKEKDGKKKIENIVVFIIILIVTVIVINTIWVKDTTNEDKTEDTSIGKQLASIIEDDKTTSNTQGDSMETKLEEILSNIDGVR